jgi:hypothetical protein
MGACSHVYVRFMAYFLNQSSSAFILTASRSTRGPRVEEAVR